jgi:UPF0755 protein
MKKLLITLGIFVIIFAAAFLWWKNGLSPVKPNSSNPQIFIVEKGQGIREVSKNLKDKGLIKDPIVFFLLTKKLGLDKKIEAGDYRLSPSMSAYQIATNLTHGTLDIWITIPEGNRADEIADILKENIPSYDENWRAQLEKNEGYLFPDTYLIPRDATIDQIITTMKDNFDSKYASIESNKSGLSQSEVVRVASMVEREARFEQDRPLVASVILNRLNIGMKLDLDATVQYAIGYQPNQKKWWKNGLTIQDLAIDSPYNTYTNNGLPPTPISNPGLASLKAVMNPASTNYIFYVSDSGGHNHYATTLEGQRANIKKYGVQ